MITAVTNANLGVRVTGHIVLVAGTRGTKYFSALPTVVLPFYHAKIFMALITLVAAVGGTPIGKSFFVYLRLRPNHSIRLFHALLICHGALRLSIVQLEPISAFKKFCFLSRCRIKCRNF